MLNQTQRHTCILVRKDKLLACLMQLCWRNYTDHCLVMLVFRITLWRVFLFIRSKQSRKERTQTRTSFLARNTASCIFTAAYFSLVISKEYFYIVKHRGLIIVLLLLLLLLGLALHEAYMAAQSLCVWVKACVCATAEKHTHTLVLKVWLRRSSGLTYILLCDHTQTGCKVQSAYEECVYTHFTSCLENATETDEVTEALPWH